MTTFLIAFGLFGLACAGMAVGVVLRGKPLSGSCGGVDPDGRPLADCLCEMSRRPVCSSRRRELGLDVDVDEKSVVGAER